MRILILCLITLSMFGCASTSQKSQSLPRGIASYEVPSAEALFLKGKYIHQKKNPLMENHFGEEIDLSVRRPVVNLSGTLFHSKYGTVDSTLIANFWHDGKFWIARIPRQSVKGVYFILSYFAPKILNQYIAAHSLLRFEMDERHPVQLVATMPDEATLDKLRALPTSEAYQALPEPLDGQEHELTNIAISAEAQWTKNDPKKAYDLKRGLQNAFIQVVRVVSMEERFKGFWENGRPVNQIKFETTKPLDPILAAGIEMSQRDGLSKLYNTLQYNCTTLAFDIVEQGMQQKDPRIGEIRKYMQKRVPIFSPSKLKAYGGLEVQPMQTDASLAEESLAAFRKVVTIPNRALCPASFVDETCPNVKQGLQTLRTSFPSEVLPSN